MEEKIIKLSSEDTRPAYLSDVLVSVIQTKDFANSFIFTIKDKEMLRITPDGFFVEGRPVPVDENHDEVVYNAIKRICCGWNNG